MTQKWIWLDPSWMEKYQPDAIAEMRGRQIMEMEQNAIAMLSGKNLEELVTEAMESELESSFAIEGIRLDSSRIRSSIVRNLGIPAISWIPPWQKNSREEMAVSASVALLADRSPLAPETLEKIHGLLDTDISFGILRKDDETVVDGNDRLIYMAPPASGVRKLMEEFCAWWNGDRKDLSQPVGAAIAHLNLVLIHPFADGNGRMARMLMKKALAENNSPLRPYSISRAIRSAPGPYYSTLEEIGSKGGNPARFVNYMLDIQEDQVRALQARTMIIAQINATRGLEPLEGEILRQMSRQPSREWKFYEAAANLSIPADEVSAAWKRLRDYGLVDGGKLVLERLGQKISARWDESVMPKENPDAAPEAGQVTLTDRRRGFSESWKPASCPFPPQGS